MNKLKTIAVLTMSMAALSTAFAAEQAVTESAQAAPVVQPQAGNVELDRIVAVVNNDGPRASGAHARRRHQPAPPEHPAPADGAAPRPGA